MFQVKLSEENMESIIIIIFGEPTTETIQNGSDGIDDDRFTKWESPEAAELYA